MKVISLFLSFLFAVICLSVNAIDMDKCPLNHKNFKIIDYPRSHWRRGWMYHYEVMAYLFKSKAERELAILRLSRAGYGEGKENYIYIMGKNISVNGKIFSNLTKAKEYIKKEKFKKVPGKVKITGVKFWLINWDKQSDYK